ncbi:MAG: ATP-binding cassette domain-containing protein [Desulfobacterales bacterium]|nr:ATP-binding cassette domain-containing protein [Desulfobacterales bacterium]
MVNIKDLTFAYSGQPPIFNGYQLEIDRGEALSIIGPSGCGKTTFLYLLAGLRHPQSGSIMVDGSPITRPRPRSGLVLQDHGLLPWQTVRENARLGLTIWEFYGSDGRHAPIDATLSPQEADHRVDGWLAKLGIEKLSDQYPLQLSRGQRQRTAIARTLAMQPDLLLMDEPFSALDAPTREDLQQFIIDLHAGTDLTYVIVTHDIEVAVVMGKKILVLEKGCNQKPQLVENTCAGLAAGRLLDEFQQTCEAVRQLLGSLT